MDTRTVRFVVEFTIYEQKFEAFESIAQEMTAESQKESGTQGYEWYLSSDRRRCRLLETYTDANAALAHMKGAAVQLVPRLLEHSRLERFEVYGDPGKEAAAMLTGMGAEMFTAWKGLSR